LGCLSEVTDTSSGFVYWQATARDAELHLTQQTMGTVLYETQGFDPNSGRVLNICATADTGNCDGQTANYSYSWDTYANLVQRADTLNNELLPVLKTPRLGVFIEPEVGHGKTNVYEGVQG
jgi:hypothetical protein